MTKFNVSFSIIGLNEVFVDRNQFHDNKILYVLYENIQKQATVILEDDTEEEALYKSKSLIQKSLAKLCFAFLDNGSIIPNGYSIKDLDNPDKLTKVCKYLTMSYNILDKILRTKYYSFYGRIIKAREKNCIRFSPKVFKNG